MTRCDMICCDVMPRP